VDLVPLIGFDSAEVSVLLAGGYQIRTITDGELHIVVQALAVPTESPSSPAAVTVRRFNQWAFTYERTVDLVVGYGSAVPAALGPSLDELADAAQRLIVALRVAVGGSVLPGRMIRHFRASLLDSPNHSVMVSRLGSVDIERPCVLLGEHAQAVVRLWTHLSRPSPGLPDAATAVALRRLVFAGGRTEPADRLLDLMIAAEALLGSTGHDRGSDKTGVKMGRMVSHVPRIAAAAGADGARIQSFVQAAYTTRNKDHPRQPQRSHLVRSAARRYDHRPQRDGRRPRHLDPAHHLACAGCAGRMGRRDSRYRVMNQTPPCNAAPTTISHTASRKTVSRVATVFSPTSTTWAYERANFSRTGGDCWLSRAVSTMAKSLLMDMSAADPRSPNATSANPRYQAMNTMPPRLAIVSNSAVSTTSNAAAVVNSSWERAWTRSRSARWRSS